MATFVPYRRDDAAQYAARWATARNPRYMNLDKLGGDCTNFTSQCLYAGCGVMNLTRNTGWYYLSPANRAPAWTGVPFFRRFLLWNAKGSAPGPFAEEAPVETLETGDFVLLDSGTRFYHSTMVVGRDARGPLLAAHTIDAYMRPLDSYSFHAVHGLHILGVRNA